MNINLLIILFIRKWNNEKGQSNARRQEGSRQAHQLAVEISTREHLITTFTLV